MMTDKMQVKKSLDSTMLDFFDTLQCLYQQHASLERMMRDGFLNLSRSRYNMGGTRNVGALQFAGNELELEPVVEVETELSDQDGPLSNGKERQEIQLNECLKIKIKLVDKRKAGPAETTEQPKEKELDTMRKRNVKKQTVDANAEIENVGSQKEETAGKQKKSVDSSVGLKDKSVTSVDKSEKSTGIKDPLLLFGILVSPHLRQSQTSFRQAVDVTVDIANLKQKLCSLRKEYINLMAQKKALESS